MQSHTLLLADVFENVRNKCIEIYELDQVQSLSATELAWQACLRKTKTELELLTDIYMLQIVGKGIRGVISHPVYIYAKANKKYMEGYN